MRDAREERRFLDELALKYATEASVEVSAEQIQLIENLRIDRYRRSQRARRHHHARRASPTVTVS